MEATELRREIECRPLCSAAAGLIVGLTALEHPANLIFLIALFAMLLTLKSRSVLIGAFCVGLLFAPHDAPISDGGFFRGEGRVMSQPKVNGTISTAEFVSERRKYLISDRRNSLEFGQKLSVEGAIQPLRDSDDFARARGILGRIKPSKLTISADPPAPIALCNHLRSNLIEFLKQELPIEASGLVSGMCLSANETISDETREQLRTTGTVHLVSSSGLHVLVLAGMLVALVARLPLARHWQLVLVSICLFGFVIASGFHTATLRAVLMAIIGMFAYRARGSFDLLSALGFVAIVDLLLRPSDVGELGFQLSFVTVGAFAMFSPRSEGNPLLKYLRPSLISAVATCPIVAQRLGAVGVGTVLANLATVVTLPVVMGGTYTSFFLSSISSPIGRGILVPVAICAGWFMKVLDWFASGGWTVQVPSFSGYWLAAVYGALLLIWRPKIVTP